MEFLKYLGTPWLKRNFNNNKLFYIKVKYIIKHLDPRDLNKIKGITQFIKGEVWQSKKEKKIIEQIDGGKDTLSFNPIRLVLHKFRDEFRIEDGVSRLRAFRKKRIKKIGVYLRIGEW